MASKAKKQVWYKIVGPNGEAVNGGSGKWSMPKNGKPGDWMPTVSHVEACASGYHLVPDYGIYAWGRSGDKLCVAEGRGESHEGGYSDGKTSFAEARIIKVIGTFPRHWSVDNDDGSRKTGRQIIAELSDPVGYRKKIAAEKAKRIAKEKAEKVKAKKERDAILKKWRPVRRLYVMNRVLIGWYDFIAVYCVIKGIKTTRAQMDAIYRAF